MSRVTEQGSSVVLLNLNSLSFNADLLQYLIAIEYFNYLDPTISNLF